MRDRSALTGRAPIGAYGKQSDILLVLNRATTTQRRWVFRSVAWPFALGTGAQAGFTVHVEANLRPTLGIAETAGEHGLFGVLRDWTGVGAAVWGRVAQTGRVDWQQQVRHLGVAGLCEIIVRPSVAAGAAG